MRETVGVLSQRSRARALVITAGKTVHKNHGKLLSLNIGG
jgi:hypothetical protein